MENSVRVTWYFRFQLTRKEIDYQFIYWSVKTGYWWSRSPDFPEIQAKWENLIGKILLQTQKRIHFHVKRNVLKPEPYKGAYNHLAQHLIINFHFWMPQQILKGKPATIGLFKHSLWSLLYPHLTSKGLKEYEGIIIK